MALMRLAALAGLSLFIAGQAWGCVCGAWPSAKDAWSESPVVFLGSVQRAEPEVEFDKTTFVEQHLWVRVDEPFKGAKKNDTFELSQAANDCAPKFKNGGRVVLYLHPLEKTGVWAAWGVTARVTWSRPLTIFCS